MGYDAGRLQNILLGGAERQKQQVEGAYRATPLLEQKFRKEQQDIGQGFMDTSKQQALEYGRNLTGIDTADLVKQRQGQAQELAFRNLPAAQQAIRENLAATGGLNRGAAVKALQQPVLQASQQAADTSFAIQAQADAENLARKQQAVENLFSTQQGATLQKLGIDKNTAMYLVEQGRGDILDRASALAGIEGSTTQGLLDIEQRRQQYEAAKESANKAKRAQLYSTLGTAAGAGIGALAGGPIGMQLGSQFGGQLGGLAGGGQANLQPGITDLAGLLMARRGTPGITSLGNRGSVNTNITSPTMLPGR